MEIGWDGLIDSYQSSGKKPANSKIGPRLILNKLEFILHQTREFGALERTICCCFQLSITDDDYKR